LGASSKASGSGATPTVADPGPVAVGAGALAYAMTMSNGLVDHTRPAGYSILADQSDGSQGLVGEAVYTVPASAGSLDPQWTWYFNSPSSWLATALVLNPPSHLAFTVQPSTTMPFLAMRPAVQVTVLDALGNPVTSFSGQVTVAIGLNGGLLAPGTLSGTKTVTVVNGVATFADLSIDQLGNGYTLVASATTTSGTASAPFNIGPL